MTNIYYRTLESTSLNDPPYMLVQKPGTMQLVHYNNKTTFKIALQDKLLLEAEEEHINAYM